MTHTTRSIVLFAIVAALYAATGFLQSWNLALNIFNMGIISAVMALGLNMQWGYAGLFNIGLMGFAALGALATVIVAMPATPGAWEAGGMRIALAFVAGAATIWAAIAVRRRMAAGAARTLVLLVVLVGGFFLYRWLFDPATLAIERINPAAAGNLGGFGLPILIAWPVGGLFAGIAAWGVGKVALGLRSDYLAIATLGIAEIIVSVLKNEDWLARGVKNVAGIPRPVPYEIDLQQSPEFIARAQSWGVDTVTASTITVKLAYGGIFLAVLLILLLLMELALKSPWGRMMRAIRDNETAAEAMGKNVKRRHLQIFILGSAVIGIAGAMMATLDSQLVPTTYTPLRFTFLIWVMVIVGGSGNNWGAVLGGFLIWFLWVQVEPLGNLIMQGVTSALPEGSWLRGHLQDSAQHMRLMTMGIILLVVLRFSPRGLIPER